MTVVATEVKLMDGNFLDCHGNKVNDMSESKSQDFVEIQAQWVSVRSRIRQKIGDAQFKSWIKQIKLINFQDKKVLLSVNSNFLKTRITEQYLDIIKETPGSDPVTYNYIRGELNNWLPGSNTITLSPHTN